MGFNVFGLMDTIKSFFSSTWINKYSISFFVFVVWIGLFDKYSWLNQLNVEKKIHTLAAQRDTYEKKFKEAKAEYIDISENSEKYIREKYFLHRENEEVFVIE